MPEVKPGNLDWLDDLAALTTEMGKAPSAKRKELAKTLDLHPSMITFHKAIKACFDPAAIEKVRQAAQGTFPSAHNALGQSNPVAQLGASQQMPYTLSFNSAQALAGLNGKVTDLHGSVHTALDIVISRQLDTKHIKALVKWMISGKPVAEFDPRKKVKESKIKEDKEEKNTDSLSGISPHAEAQQASLSNLGLKKVAELLKKAETKKALGKETTAQKKLLAYFQTILESAPSKLSSSKKGTQGDSNWVETVYLSWLADVSLIKKIKSKIVKGQPVTKGEVALLWLHKLGEGAGWIGKHVHALLIKPLLKFGHIIWKLLMEALEVLGLLKYIKAVLVISGFVIFGWFAWEAWHYGFMHPVKILEPYCFRKTEESPASEAPAQVPQTPISIGLGQSKHVSRPVVSTQTYQPSIAWQSSAEDQTVLDTEMAALPVNCVIKDYPLAPDEGMHGDMAVSRLQDLTNADKYTMKIGNGTQKILSVNATTTNLTITYKSTDPLVLDRPDPMNFFWEDVLVIHVDEVDVQGKTPKTFYQCSLIVSGAKEPLTVQCSTPADLKHLVSTMEYFIRASRLAHDTALAGMPYPCQGLRLNNDGLVDKLWANSPVGHAEVKLGDLVWSLEKDGFYAQNPKDLESQLAALTSGSHVLYIVSPSDREKGLVDMSANHSKVFNPQRSKIILIVS